MLTGRRKEAMKVRLRDSEYYAERLKVAAPVGLFVVIIVLMVLISNLFS